MSVLPSSPPPPGDYGYSCQCWLAVEVAKGIFGAGIPWAWFSLQFNPEGNVPSSNPLDRYAQLSRAVQEGDINSVLIKGYRANLLDMINKKEGDGSLTPPQASQYRTEVTRAPIEWFRPEVWRLDLKAISKRKYGFEDVDGLKAELRARANREVIAPQVLQDDEYLIHDLQNGESQVIIQ